MGKQWELICELMGGCTLPWAHSRSLPSTRALDDLWAKEARTAVLELPSAIVHCESNYFLNPAHPDFRKIVIGKPASFSFDPRLL